jgi:hypothetical protein
VLRFRTGNNCREVLRHETFRTLIFLEVFYEFYFLWSFSEFCGGKATLDGGIFDVNAATVLGSIPAYSDTAESKGLQMKHC